MKRIFFMLFSLVSSFVALAQEGAKVDINVNKGGNWYASPWVWVVGAAIFILLLVALLRGGGRNNN